MILFVIFVKVRSFMIFAKLLLLDSLLSVKLDLHYFCHVLDFLLLLGPHLFFYGHDRGLAGLISGELVDIGFSNCAPSLIGHQPELELFHFSHQGLSLVIY